MKKLKVTDTIRDSGEFEGNSLSGSSCSPSNRRGQGLPIPKYNFLNVPDGSGNTEGPQSSRFERRRKSSCAILETQDKTNVEKRESSQEVKPSGESLGIPKPTNGLLKWPSITPSQIPEPDWENCSEQGVTEKSEGDSIVFSRINDTASLYPAGTEKTSKQSPSVATISLQVPYSSPKMKSRFNTRPDLQNCKPGLKVTSIAPEILLQPLSTIQMTGECSHSPDSKLLSPNISTVKSGQSPKGILTKSKPEFAGQNRIMQSGSLTTSLLVEPDKAKNSDLMDRPSNQEQLSLSTNPNHTVSDKSSQALVSSQPFRQRNPIKRSKHSFIINKANTQAGKKEDVLPQGHLTESTPFLETQQLHQTTEIDQLDQDNLESLLYQSLADKQKLAQELSKLESKISMIKSVIQKNRSRTTSKINDTEWLNIEENKTIKYSPRMNQQRFAETRANQDMRPDFAAEIENDKKLLESYASQHIPSKIEGSHQFVPQRIDASKHGVQQDEHGDSSNLSNGLNSEAITHSWQSREKPHRIQRRGNGRQVHVTERERKFLVRPQQRIWLPGSEVSVEKRPRSQFKSFNTNCSVSTEKRFEVPLRNIGRSMDFTPFIRKELSRDTQVDPNLSKSINANDFSVNSKSVDTQSQVSRNLKAILGGKKSPLVKKLKQPIKQVDLLVRRDSVLVKGQEPRTNLKSTLVRGSTPIFQSFLFE